MQIFLFFKKTKRLFNLKHFSFQKKVHEKPIFCVKNVAVKIIVNTEAFPSLKFHIFFFYCQSNKQLHSCACGHAFRKNRY